MTEYDGDLSGYPARHAATGPAGASPGPRLGGAFEPTTYRSATYRRAPARHADRDALRDTPRGRLPLVAFLLAAAVAIMVNYQYVSGIEADLAARVVAAVLHQHTLALSDRALVILHVGGPREIGLQITPQCTSAFLISPMVLTAAALTWLRPRQYKRILTGLVITTVLLFATNQLRILGLAALIDSVGFTVGYYWGHTILGSMVSVVGGGASLLTFVYWTLVRGHRARIAPRPATADEAP